MDIFIVILCALLIVILYGAIIYDSGIATETGFVILCVLIMLHGGLLFASVGLVQSSSVISIDKSIIDIGVEKCINNGELSEIEYIDGIYYFNCGNMARFEHDVELPAEKRT